MEKTTLTAQARDIFGKKLAISRKNGSLPAIVYGQDKDNEAIFLNTHDFSRTYTKAGHNTIIDLKIDQNTSDNVLIQDVSLDPLTGELTHADLYRVNMSEAIKTTVPLHFVGDAPAVYQQEGTLLTNIEEVEVETLPGKLPSNIEVDISGLDDFEKSIHVRDLVVPEGVEILVDGEELVAKVDPPRSEEEMEALNEDIVEEIPAEEGAETEEDAEVKEAGEKADQVAEKTDK
ncbi:50S ribosomal protein L25 [Candidatus Saccharibacteria bacterium]|nr:50S ribosomal protein L25 [Candidatus Saccharibacteria bacterium]